MLISSSEGYLKSNTDFRGIERFDSGDLDANNYDIAAGDATQPIKMQSNDFKLPKGDFGGMLRQSDKA